MCARDNFITIIRDRIGFLVSRDVIIIYPPLGICLSSTCQSVTEVVMSSKSAKARSKPPKGVPKLPPRTYRKSSSVEAPKLRQLPTIIDEKEYSSKELIAEKALPQMVTVTSGYDGATPENCVGVGEEFIVSFAKSTKVIPAKLVDGTDEIFLPADSMLSLGVVMKGGTKTYHTVQDLLRLSVLPLVVTVNCGFTTNGHCVEKNSTLYITGRDGQNALFCQHESGGVDLTLTPDLVGKFSNDPEDATIFIADYTTMYNVYPITVILLQIGVDVDDHLEQYIRQTFILEAPIDKMSLIATTDVSGSRIEDPAVVEIPMDIPLLFKCIERPELDMEKAYRPAVELCRKFDPTKVDVTYGTTCIMSENDYAEIRELDDENENVYVSFDIVCPNPRSETMKKALADTRSKNTKAMPEKSKKQALQNKKSSSLFADARLERKLAAEKKQVDELTTNNVKLTNEVDTLKTQLHFSEQNCSDLEGELSRVKKNVAKLSTQLEQLTQLQLGAANHGASGAPASPTSPTTTTVTTAEENQERLRQMDAIDVGRLLKSMGYGMYEKNFSAEYVDGMLLSTLEEEHLKELGVKNSLHCRRILNVIQGKESVNKYL